MAKSKKKKAEAAARNAANAKLQAAKKAFNNSKATKFLETKLANYAKQQQKNNNSHNNTCSQQNVNSGSYWSSCQTQVNKNGQVYSNQMQSTANNWVNNWSSQPTFAPSNQFSGNTISHGSYNNGNQLSAKFKQNHKKQATLRGQLDRVRDNNNYPYGVDTSKDPRRGYSKIHQPPIQIINKIIDLTPPTINKNTTKLDHDIQKRMNDYKKEWESTIDELIKTKNLLQIEKAKQPPPNMTTIEACKVFYEKEIENLKEYFKGKIEKEKTTKSDQLISAEKYIVHIKSKYDKQCEELNNLKRSGMIIQKTTPDTNKLLVELDLEKKASSSLEEKVKIVESQVKVVKDELDEYQQLLRNNAAISQKLYDKIDVLEAENIKLKCFVDVEVVDDQASVSNLQTQNRELKRQINQATAKSDDQASVSNLQTENIELKRQIRDQDFQLSKKQKIDSHRSNKSLMHSKKMTTEIERLEHKIQELERQIQNQDFQLAKKQKLVFSKIHTKQMTAENKRLKREVVELEWQIRVAAKNVLSKKTR